MSDETVDECECGGAGYLLDMTYGLTSTPADHEGARFVQRCDLCERFDGDIAAAEAAAVALDGRAYVWRLVPGVDVVEEQTDAWIVPGVGASSSITWLEPLDYVTPADVDQARRDVECEVGECDDVTAVARALNTRLF